MFGGFGEDLVGGLRPDERLGALVVALDEEVDRGDQLGDVVVDAAADLLAGEGRETDLAPFHPGGAVGGGTWKCTRLGRCSQRLPWAVEGGEELSRTTCSGRRG